MNYEHEAFRVGLASYHCALLGLPVTWIKEWK